MDDSRVVIELINKLQRHFKTTGYQGKIELPQIVVVGAQSSGKSSVLDGLVGFSILPRGSGTVTKCPIIVQLITTTDPYQEGIEFEDDPGAGKIKDHDIVREKIFRLMNKAGGAIVDTPIIIRVYSPDVVTLTVVDLPGIKRLTSAGEPSDLENLIFGLSRKYISEKNAIILAVSPANYDICNSDGILLAKEADPEGDRTIGVLTKLDLMDEGTDARELLTGTSKDVQVKLGMIGLVNRSQKDVENNLSVEGQLEKEKRFLNENYSDLAHRNGVPFLRKRLHDLLVNHIRKCLPEILAKSEETLEECDNRLTSVPNVVTKKDKFAHVNKIIHGFETRMITEIDGSARTPEYNYLYGGIVIKEIFDTKFAKSMENAGRTAASSITDEMIQTAFRNSGSYDSMFVYPEAVFRKLAINQVKHLEKPALKCAEDVHEQILRIAHRNLNDAKSSFEYFPELKKEIKSVVHSMLNSKLDDVKQQIGDYIRIQSSIVFSLDQPFLNKIASLRRKLEKNLHPVESSGEEADGVPAKRPRKSSRNDDHDIISRVKDPGTIKLIKEMGQIYFDLIKSQTQDYIPKLVVDRLITQFSRDGLLGAELRLKVLENYEQLATLPENLSERRERDVLLQRALREIIAEIKEIIDDNEDGDSGYAGIGQDVEDSADNEWELLQIPNCEDGRLQKREDHWQRFFCTMKTTGKRIFLPRRWTGFLG